ncbi:MAG TPA: response regulator transcription factor [Polyangiaceae bacterium]|nr:response regulator transcription factor [Polyangiaceae bacterium]
MRLLLVDDSPELLDLVVRALSKDGHEVETASDVASALSAVNKEEPEVMVLDLALPDGTGIDLCSQLRQAGRRFPILLLTAHGEVHRRVEGLNAGADDFLSKPFAMAELRARVRALARRGPLVRQSSRLCVGAVELDLAARRAYHAGEEVPVTGREWSILELLATRKGRVVERYHILETIWDDTSEASNASLDVIVGRLRRKLGSDIIRTVRGQGYSLDED